LPQVDIDRLLDAMRSNSAGAILATPVTDTLKQATADQTIAATRSREGLWRALTPQGFLLSEILAALDRVIENDLQVTDDASAMELCGYHPTLVDADPRNIKLTHANDLAIATMLLESQ
jgi:2-C-methyl-D-erythritol 4-phosphate cytidylyltransferase